MKKINKSIISFVILISMWINSVFAAGFPSEPMVIYGSVEWLNIENRILKIYDGDDILLKTIDLVDGNFGTNKTFDLDNKVSFNEYNWELQFFIDDYALQILDNNINDCNWNFSFKSWGLCELHFKDANLKIDTLDDLDNIPEEEKSEEFEDVYSWKVIESTKDEVKQNLWDNIVSGTTTTWSIVIVNKAVKVDVTVIKDLVLISDTQKELVFIPKDTNTWNSDLIIQKPVKITSLSSIKSKINKDVFGAIEIPTNNQVNFDKFIRICLDTSENSVSGLKIYASHDNNSWFFDSSARNLSIKNSQICFDVNHLTSFAVTKDVQKSSGWGSGGWGWYSKWQSATTTYKTSLTNSNIWDNIMKTDWTLDTKQKIITGIEKFQIIDTKLTSKKYITWVRTFISNKREVRQKYGLQVSYVKSDDEYNETIDLLLKDINNSMKIKSIKQDMVKHIDTMSTSYAVANDNSVNEDLRKTFKVKLENDIVRVQQKMKVLKRKDYIVNKALNERELRRLEQ